MSVVLRRVRDLHIGDHVAGRGVVTSIDTTGPHGLWRVEIVDTDGPGWYPWAPDREVAVKVPT